MAHAHYDLIVIGTGPAGEGAAMKAAKAGKSVAAIEQYSEVGGGATHWGTIPSKALRAAIQHVNLVHQNLAHHKVESTPSFSFPTLLHRAHSIVEMQAEVRASLYQCTGVQLHHGHARFLDAHTIRVEHPGGAQDDFAAEAFIIATGSRPYRPADIDFAHPRILDSDKLLGLKHTPRTAVIYGAGVIGCEYASMLDNMGIDVTLVDTRQKLLEFLDAEISDALSFHFSDSGIRILHNEEYERIEIVGGDLDDHNGYVALHLKSGKVVKADVLLFATGRSGNSDNLGLDCISVVPNSRGQIEVNDKLQVKIAAPEHAEKVSTTPAKPSHEHLKPAHPRPRPTGQAAIVGSTKQMSHASADGDNFHPHIFAAGDIIGVPALASASYDQGRFAATLVVSGKCDYELVHDIPTGIYTTPEISSLGRTEAQLTQDKVPYEAGVAQFRTLARAQITGRTAGMLKLLFHRETLELLGIHCFGDNASEIIHIGQAIMYQPHPNNTLNYFLHTTFNFPTMAEAYRVAALNGLDRL
jgi:NAD(P) transhydrogenase